VVAFSQVALVDAYSVSPEHDSSIRIPDLTEGGMKVLRYCQLGTSDPKGCVGDLVTPGVRQCLKLRVVLQ